MFIEWSVPEPTKARHGSSLTRGRIIRMLSLRRILGVFGGCLALTCGHGARRRARARRGSSQAWEPRRLKRRAPLRSRPQHLSTSRHVDTSSGTLRPPRLPRFPWRRTDRHADKGTGSRLHQARGRHSRPSGARTKPPSRPSAKRSRRPKKSCSPRAPRRRAVAISAASRIVCARTVPVRTASGSQL